MHTFYLDAIRNFEGFTPAAKADYAQFSNGYGTKARFAGEVIDRAEAERRFQAEIAEARAIVDKTAGNLDEGTKAALTSLTYNAGTAWVSSGLGDAVRRGDLSEVREIFQQYNKAGGEVLPGLVSRRSQEAMWIGNPEMVADAAVRQSPVVSVAVAAQGIEAASDASALPVLAERAQALASSPMRINRTSNDVAALLRAAAQTPDGPAQTSAHGMSVGAEAASPRSISLEALLQGSGVDVSGLSSTEQIGRAFEAAQLLRMTPASGLRADDRERRGERSSLTLG